MRIKYKFTFILLFFTLLPILIGGFFLYEHSRRSLLASTIENLKSIAIDKEALIEEMIQKQGERVNLLTNRPGLKKIVKDYLADQNPQSVLQLQEILRSMSDSLDWVHNMMILNAQGKVVAASSTIPETPSVTTESLRKAKAGFYLSVSEVETGEAKIYLYGPIFNNRELLGFLCIETSARIFYKAVRNYVGLGETGEVVLAQLNSAGKVVFIVPKRFEDASKADGISFHNFDYPMSHALRKKRTVLLNGIDYRGESVIAVTRYIDLLDWGLVVKKDRREIFAPINQVGNINLGILLLMALLMMLVSFRGSVMVTRPISRLHDAVLKISEGDLAPRVNITSQDEIGQLSVSFNTMGQKLKRMTDELRHRETELRRHNEILTILNQIRLSLTSEFDMKKNLQQIANAAVKLSGAQSGVFFFHGSAASHPENYFASVSPDISAHLILPPEPGTALFTELFIKRQCVHQAHIQRDQIYAESFFEAGRIKSLLAVPVISRTEEVFGAFLLIHEEEGVFNDVHQEIVSGLAAQAAIRIENVRLVEDLKKTQDELKKVNLNLEEKVRERTVLAERRAEKLRELAAALTLAEQKERRRLAQILHDHLQQMLIAARIGLTRLKKEMPEEKLTAMIQVEELIDSAVAASRSFTVELCPPVLRDAGLEVAMDWLSRWFREKHHLSVEVFAEEDLKTPSEELKIFLFQAVRELLFNVVKHSGIDRASIHLSSTENEICIVVEDKGNGFSPDEVAKQEKAGFGLFHIRERLEMLGGRMEIESAPGHGTLFSLYAPAEEPASKPVVLSAEAKEKSKELENNKKTPGTIRILVVDDHKILRQGLINMLEGNRGIRVVGEAADGEEALQKVEDLMPDVVIMDISMPKMNGIEATQRIKHRSPSVQIIGLSLHDSEDMAETMRVAGASAYLSKDGPVTGLVKTIRRITSHRRDFQGALFENLR